MSKYASTFAGTGPVSRAAYYVARAIVATATRLYTRMQIDGREHLPSTGAFVLAPVHRSFVDTPISSCLTRRRLRFMGKDSMWKYRFSSWLLSSLGGFPVSRGTADREALKRCVAVLEGGEPLVLYPEGERKSGPVVQPLFDGAAYVALRAGVPIVPVGIGGSERVMPKGAKFVFPRKVHVVIGEAIQPSAAFPTGGSPRLSGHAGREATSSDRGRVPRSAIRSHSDRLHTTLQELFDEAMRRVGTPNEY